ncbi:CBS domain-containing protein [Virgibacillus byunsanensis]|uniref:CBS domain-containing protein n=1 Tax=Virgibacillus byunsanensis TaxID=570945 RepID=A0ABW3LQZ8_9BACI
MHTNSEKFLTTFTRIEKELKSMMSHEDAGFSRMVKILRDYNGIVKRYGDDLLEFAALRNAIVHNKIDMSYAIAEPHDSVVKRIEDIERELTQPEEVVPLFARKVYTFQETETLSSLLRVVHEKAFSKFPIYNGEDFKGLITQKGITNWIASNVETDELPTMETTLSEVLRFEERGNYKFIKSNTAVLEAVAFFREQIGRGIRLEALLITSNGQSTEKPAGIITAWDILEIP